MANRVELLPAVSQFLAKQKGLLIDGEWVQSQTGKMFTVENPATSDVLTQVAHGQAADVDKAVMAARRAFDTGAWSSTTASDRSKMMWKLADLLEAHAEEFAQLESLDNGKPFGVARAADIPLAIENFRYMAGWATKIHGHTIPLSVPYTPKVSYLAYTLKEPVGVVGQIIPWNFPLLMAAWKMAPALAAGCTIILKPAEQTPLTALRLGELVMEAGFPKGVVNIISGFGDAGAALVANPRVDKVAFTGSTEVGKEIVRGSAHNLKKVSLELGGKSPNIIFKDANLDLAIPGAASAIFFNHGQCCCAGSRLYIESEVYDEVIRGVSEYAKKIRVGDGMESGTQMGPVVSKDQFTKICAYLESGRLEGATVAAGGNPLDRSGYFIEPTVLTGTNKDMRVVKEEIFGPVVAAMPFKTLDEVVDMANDSVFGLAAGIWTQDITTAHRTSSRLKAGTTWINCYNIFDAALPFGGYKESGWGREMGEDALRLYTETKSVCLPK